MRADNGTSFHRRCHQSKDYLVRGKDVREDGVVMTHISPDNILWSDLDPFLSHEERLVV